MPISKLEYLIVLLAVSVQIIGQHVESTKPKEIRYKVCSAEELRQEIEHTCMRFASRDGNSNLSLNPYGSSLSSSQLKNEDWIKPSDADLIKFIQVSQTRGRRQLANPRRLVSRKQLFKRSLSPSIEELCDYIDSCCNRSCSINVEDLAPFCRFKYSN
jgi:hypothetical protein